MVKKIINIPTIRDDERGYNQIFKIANEVFDNPKQHFDFDFKGCARIDHNGVVILGGLAQFVNYQNSLASRSIGGVIGSKALYSAGVMFKVDSMSELISNQLIENNFLNHFTQENFQGYKSGDYIGYRQHNSLLDADEIAFHLNEKWLSAEKLSITPRLKEAIVSRIFEIFMNAYGHGTSIQNIRQLGVYSCGQYDKKERKLNLSVVDFGPGIITNVRNANPGITDEKEAMNWALMRGNSTRTDSQGIDMPRGLGFDLLHEFVKLNLGVIRVYSNGVSAISSKGEPYKISENKYEFNGTMVSIQINCDNRHYRLFSESVNEQHKFY
ncbi:hypothetical protein LZP73_07350 [Shewanella sp. AS16]|uniref:hypothetical protein n=1 Tax=Shewanella sp. AS16 TaxID=2907625 RepID=UPI001F4510C2|nr:hypothetical protein [Shewanella sp. AS16]MCE9686031.1 hypothetical protein [Shewanella sp. AS16]